MVLKADIRDISKPINRVVAIFRKCIGDESYSEITYVAKGENIKTLPVSKSIKLKIDTSAFN